MNQEKDISAHAPIRLSGLFFFILLKPIPQDAKNANADAAAPKYYHSLAP